MTLTSVISARRCIVLGMLCVLWTTGCRPNGVETKSVWLPYASGLKASCGQGPQSSGTHQGIFAWDFLLAEGMPIVAAGSGRVFWVIDDQAKTGANSFNDSNHIFIDQGGGLFATYTHHRTGTAVVSPGQLVFAGTYLADVGKTGTITPHIHFDLRGPSWHQTHDVRFRTAEGSSVEVKQGATVLSATSAPDPGIPEPDFEDSRMNGHEFLENGVTLKSGGRAFWLQSEKETVFEGRVLQPARTVGFYLWRNGQKTEYARAAVPDVEGNFRLAVSIPSGSKGPRWYRITIEEVPGHFLDIATLPVMIE